jgi:hypothetical protein
MDPEEFYRLIAQGENQQVEFKHADDTLPNSVWESYAALLIPMGQNCFGLE